MRKQTYTVQQKTSVYYFAISPISRARDLSAESMIGQQFLAIAAFQIIMARAAARLAIRKFIFINAFKYMGLRTAMPALQSTAVNA